MRAYLSRKGIRRTDRRVELGEGTFLRRTVYVDLNMIAYECEEHTILARGDHFIRLHGRLQFVLAKNGLAPNP